MANMETNMFGTYLNEFTRQ